MTTIVVGGHSRKVGKTSVTGSLIRALPGYSWTALKISSHLHSGAAGECCVIREEFSREGETDSSRFLSAGAARSFWVQFREGHADEAAERLSPLLQSSPFLIIESNCILRYLEPDFCLFVLSYDVGEFKQSARETLARAHAVVAAGTPGDHPWHEQVRQILAGIPMFPAAGPGVLPPGLLELVRSKLPG